MRRRHAGLRPAVAAVAVLAVGCGSTDGVVDDAAISEDEDVSDDVSTPDESETAAEPVAAEPGPLAVEPPEPLPVDPPDGMELVWSDEFDGDAIDRSNWTFDIGGWGWGNGEAQYYTDRPVNARVEEGLLVIELHQEQYDGSYYTSARLRSQGLREFQYGRIEARIRVPKGAGTWPAFWMLGAAFDPDSEDPAKQWPNVGEIDVMEYVGREPDLVLGTVHGPGYAGAGGLTKWHRQEHDIGDDFHTFAIDWDEAGIRWLYDGEVFHDLGREGVGNREWVFDQPFFLILNLALGGTLGGPIALDLEFPIQYHVDHVRVYQDVDA